MSGTFVSMLGIILYLLFAYASLHSGSLAHDWILGTFSDFVYIMNTSLEESPYICEQSSYPPFAILILLPFALICKKQFALYSNVTLSVDELTEKMLRTPEFWVAYLLFFFVTTVAILLLVIKKFELDRRSALLVALLIPVSAPFIFAVMRGNTIYFALIFLLLFLLLKDSKSPVAREISYIALALAGAIKIYPLFFGVFLLAKKKFFASFRVAVYFFAILFTSFFFFRSGINDFDIFIDNLGGFMSNDNRLLAGNNLSISSIIYRISYLFSPALADSTAMSVITTVILALIFTAATVLSLFTRSDLSRYTIAAAIVILIPPISYFYVLIFAILPMIEFIRGSDTIDKKKRICYSIMFGFIMFTPALLPQYYIVHSLAIITMLTWESVSVIKNELIPRKKFKAIN